METVSKIFRIEDLILGFNRPIHDGPLNFSIPSGKLVAVLGLNGSGKSTLLSVLCGGSGRLSGNAYFGEDKTPIHKFSATKLAEVVAYVPQEHPYPAHFRGVDLMGMALLQRVGVWGRLPGKSDPEIRSLSEKLRIAELLEKNLGEMSAGERQRFFLARAILQKPKVLVLDEPTNHLDPNGVEKIWDSLNRVASAERLSVILSTHDLSFVERFSDHILALGKGGVQFQGSKEKYLEECVARRIFQSE